MLESCCALTSRRESLTSSRSQTDSGDRLVQLKQLINLRLGVSAADDRLPARFTTESRPTGGAAGVLPDMAAMMPVYYELRGWGPDGAPSPERLAQLGIEVTHA